MKVKAKCARALIRYLKAKESERENSNELCTTKLYYATCRQRVCGQNKDNLCLHAARTLIWRSCAFNRGPMTMPVLDGPMTMPVLDGVKPMAITLPICGTSESLFWKRKKSIYCWTRSETGLEYYSPNLYHEALLGVNSCQIILHRVLRNALVANLTAYRNVQFGMNLLRAVRWTQLKHARRGRQRIIEMVRLHWRLKMT